MPRIGVPGVFGAIPNIYLGISLWDGGPEAIEWSAIKRRDVSLRESHDISVGISAHQILVRFDGREYKQTPYEGDRLIIN